MSDQTISDNKSKQYPPKIREWLLMQAQLQLDYARVENAIVLLKLVESVFGKSVSTALMLCKAWLLLRDQKRLEKQVKETLVYPSLTREQLAAVYYSVSQMRWQAGDKTGAKKAHASYLKLINTENDKK